MGYPLTTEAATPRAPATATRRPVVVELVGLPGAGKTTAASAAVRRLRDAGMRCLDRRSLARDRAARGAAVMREAAYHAGHPGRIVTALRFGASVRPFGAGRLRHALRLADWSYRLDCARRRGAEVVLLDQGPVQDAWSAALRARSWSEHRLAAALGPVLAEPGLRFAFVILEVDPEAAAARIRARPATTSRFDGMPERDAARLLDRHRRDLERMLALTAALAGVAVHRIDGRAPAAVVVEELVAHATSISSVGASWGRR